MATTDKDGMRLKVKETNSHKIVFKSRFDV
jgi:hypothetical protein